MRGSRGAQRRRHVTPGPRCRSLTRAGGAAKAETWVTNMGPPVTMLQRAARQRRSAADNTLNIVRLRAAPTRAPASNARARARARASVYF